MFRKVGRIVRKIEFAFYFCGNIRNMSHDQKEAEQNEIGGPVLLAVVVLALIVLTIYFLG
jgi:hypothetical protein